MNDIFSCIFRPSVHSETSGACASGARKRVRVNYGNYALCVFVWLAFRMCICMCGDACEKEHSSLCVRVNCMRVYICTCRRWPSACPHARLIFHFDWLRCVLHTVSAYRMATNTRRTLYAMQCNAMHAMVNLQMIYTSTRICNLPCSSSRTVRLACVSRQQ